MLLSNSTLTGITTTVNLLPDALEGFTQRREGGNIDITANSLSLTNGSQIQSSTFGIGDAGDINLNVVNDLTLDGIDSTTAAPSSLQSNVESGAIGNGGVINIKSKNLSLTNGGQIQSIVRESNASQVGGNGIGGNIVIDVDEAVIVKGFSETININGFDNNVASLISSSLNFGATGQSGNIDVIADSLSLSEGGRISSSTFGEGSAGNIAISIENDLVLDGTGQFISNGNTTIISSGLFSNVGEFAIGDGGNIKLTLGDSLILRENSIISTQATNDGDGGNIDIDTDFIVAFPNEIAGNGSDIITKAAEGNGGNINITAESLLGIEEGTATPGNGTNDIDASSDFGLDGSVSIFTPDTSVIQGVTELPNNIVEPSQTIAQACSNDRSTALANNFVIKGKGGIAPLITAPLSSEMITINGEIAANSSEGYAIPTSIGDITPARGVIKTPDGRIILTATPVSGSTSRMAHGSLNCG